MAHAVKEGKRPGADIYAMQKVHRHLKSHFRNDVTGYIESVKT